MSTLYNISEDILKIFNEIENNDGEVTDEQYNDLIIKEEELKNKLENYCNAIKIWNNDAETCKAEKKRINDVQKKYENRIERVKSYMLHAVQNFGQQGKTNKFVELPTYRVFTKNINCVELDDERCAILLEEFKRYINELVKEGLLYTGKDVDFEGILEVMNANIKATYGDDIAPFTFADLCSLNVVVQTSASIYDYFRNHKEALEEFANNDNVEMFIQNDKIKLKDHINYFNSLSKNSDSGEVTIAKIVQKDSLQIK